MLGKLPLYIYTAKYFRAGQIAARLQLLARRGTVYRFPGYLKHRYRPPELPRVRTAARFRPADALDSVAAAWTRWKFDSAPLLARAADLRRGRFTLLNETRDLGRPVDWQPDGATRLWQYNLHYFDYAVDLVLAARIGGDKDAVLCLEGLINHWIEANAVGQGMGWHAYPLARRVVNWIQVLGVRPPAAPFRTGLGRSLYEQALFLEDHLELDSLGNHLLADAKALVFAGLYFDNGTAARWMQRGMEILEEGLQEQILPDGGHYERAPMYHAQVLQDYLEVLIALRDNNRPVPTGFEKRVIDMADFLAGIRHPDGEIPLFGDSAVGVMPPANDLLAAAALVLDCPGRWAGVQVGSYTATLTGTAVPIAEGIALAPLSFWPHSGYCALRGPHPDDYLIADVQRMGPDHVPAHGHCSLFSYELSIRGQRLIVDSGVGEYERGPWREFWRGTRAHNTVTVDGAEQSEIWAAFRVGRRATVLQAVLHEIDGAHVFIGAHDGFARSGRNVWHRRILVRLHDCPIWAVLDRVIGEGEHSVESYVHFHPQATCAIESKTLAATLGTLATRILPSPLPELELRLVIGAIDPIQGWHAAMFGRRVPNPVLVLTTYGQLPIDIGYLIVPESVRVDGWEWRIQTAAARTVVTIEVRTDRATKRAEFDIESGEMMRHT